MKTTKVICDNCKEVCIDYYDFKDVIARCLVSTPDMTYTGGFMDIDLSNTSFCSAGCLMEYIKGMKRDGSINTPGNVSACCIEGRAKLLRLDKE